MISLAYDSIYSTNVLVQLELWIVRVYYSTSVLLLHFVKVVVQMYYSVGLVRLYYPLSSHHRTQM